MSNSDNIQENFKHIIESLDSMRAQNAMNSGDLDKVLLNINSKLESLSSEENSDLIKVFLAELKRSLDERHNFVSSRFTEIENSFKTLSKKAEGSINSGEVKEAFDVIGFNLNGFSKEFVAQRELVAQIGLKIDDFRNDDSDKKDILKNISTLKVEVEKTNNGLESVVISLGDNFKTLSEQVSKLDTNEPLKAIKKDIEDVFLSSNAILSAIKVVDHKNRELEDIITHLVTKEDFTLERDQVANLIAQNIQITDYIEKLPTQTHFMGLAEKVDTAVGVISALKTVITDNGKQNQQMLTAQLDNLEAKILNISTEEEFIGFRKELSAFAKEVVDSSNAMRADLADTNSELKSLLSFLSSMDMKNSFETFANLTKVSEANVKESISKLSGDVSKDIDKARGLVKSDVEGSTSVIVQKLDAVKSELNDASSMNLAGILESIQTVINNIFSVKNSLHIEGLENIENIEGKLSVLKEEIIASNSFVAQSSKADAGDILYKVEKIFKELSAVKDVLGNNSSEQAKNVEEKFAEISGQLSEVKNELSQNNIGNNENFPNLFAELEKLFQEFGVVKSTLSQNNSTQSEKAEVYFGGLSQKIEGLKEELSKNSQESFAGILSIVQKFTGEIEQVKDSLKENADDGAKNNREFIEDVSDKLNSLQDNLIRISELGAAEVKNTAEEIGKTLQATKAGLEQISSTGFAGLKVSVEQLSQDLDLMNETFDNKRKSNFEAIVSLFDTLSEHFDAYKDFASENAHSNFETISASIQDIERKIENAKNDLGVDIKSNLSELQNSILALPSIIKENQSVFEAEKRVLIEENSKNIEEMSDKIQDLVKGIIAKENPFKGEVLYEFAELKVNLENIKEELNKSNSSLNENVKNDLNSTFQSLETVINNGTEGYNSSLNDLQEKLVEYLELIKNTTQESDSKLNSSIQETVELKTEIESISKSLVVLKTDNRLNNLSAEVNQKLDGILFNINHAEEVLSANSKDNLQAILENLESKFSNVLEDLQEYKKTNAGAVDTTNEFIEQLVEKIETLKGQIRLTNTDVINTLTAKTDEIVTGFAPVVESIEKVARIDFSELFEVKNQIDESYASIASFIKENLKEESTEQSQKLTENFNDLQEKLNEISTNLAFQRKENLEELKSELDELSKNIGYISSRAGESNENTRALMERFNSVESNLLENQNEIRMNLLDKSEQNVSLIKNQLDGFTKNVENIFTSLSSTNKEEIVDKLGDRVSDIEDKMLQEQIETRTSLASKFEGSTSSIKFELEEISSEIENISVKIEESNNDDLIEKIANIEDKLIQGQNETNLNLLEKFENNASSIKSELDEISREIENISVKIIEASNDDLIGRFTNVEDKLIQSQNEINMNLLDKFEDNASSIKSELNELVNIIENQQEKLESSHSEIIDALSVKSKDDEDLDFAAVKTALVEEISLKLEGFKQSVQATSEDIENKLYRSEENYKLSSQSLFSEIKTSFCEKVEDELDDLKSFMEVLGTRNDYTLSIDNLKSDVFDKFIELADNVEASVASAIVKDDLQIISKEIENSVNDSLENLYDKVLLALEDNKLINDVFDKTEEVTRRVEDLKRVITEDISEKFDNFELKIDTQSQDFSNLIEEIKVSLSELKENYVELTVNSSMEISNSLISIEEKIEGISDKVAGLTFEDAIENLKSQLMDELGLVKEIVASSDLGTKVTEGFESVNQKLDILALESSEELEEDVREIKEIVQSQSKIMESFSAFGEKLDVLSANSNEELEEDVKTIKNVVQSQSKVLGSLKALEQLEKLSNLDGLSEAQNDTKTALEGISEAQTEVKSILDGFEEKLNLLAVTKPENDETADEIKTELNTLKKDVIENILTVFDQVSFVVEAEEIKDFVEEKTEALKKEILSKIDKISVGGNLSEGDSGDILSCLEALNERTNSVDDNCFDIINEIKEVKNHLEAAKIGTDGESDYSYSFQDIESDIAKVRLILKDIAQSKSDDAMEKLNYLDRLSDLDKLNGLDKLNQDIMSISTRTNKLLLNSDESYNIMKTNLEDFKETVYKLEEKVKYMDMGEFNRRTEKKLEDVKNLALSSVQSNKVFNQAFTYLAEWVDNTSENIGSISERVEKVSEIEGVKNSIADIKKTLSKKTEMDTFLEKISEKFEQQQEKIESLENKITQLSKKTVKGDVDVEAVVKAVLEQIGTSEAKPDAKLAKKVDNIDKQLAKLSKGIEKITSYVEEE